MISGWCGSGKDTLADYCSKHMKSTKLSIANELKQLVAKKYKFDYDLTQSQSGKKTNVYISMKARDGSEFTQKKTVREILIDEALLQKKLNGINVFIKSLAKTIMFLDKYYFNKQKIRNPQITKNPNYLKNHHEHLCENIYESTYDCIDQSWNDNVSYYPTEIIDRFPDQKTYYMPHIIIPDFRFPHEYNYLYDNFHGKLEHGEITKIITIRVNRFEKPPINDPSETSLNDFEFDFTIENKSTITDFHKNIHSVLYEIDLVK